MANMIDNLFFANQNTTFLNLKKGSDYNKKLSEILSIIDKLEDNSLEHDAALLRKNLNDLDLITSHAYFSIGFHWGAQMALTITDDDIHNTFSIPAYQSNQLK